MFPFFTKLCAKRLGRVLYSKVWHSWKQLQFCVSTYARSVKRGSLLNMKVDMLPNFVLGSLQKSMSSHICSVKTGLRSSLLRVHCATSSSSNAQKTSTSPRKWKMKVAVQKNLRGERAFYAAVEA
jgi:hypothetical protein